MRRRLAERWYAFVLAEDVPHWQLYARRLGVPLVLGTALGLLLAVVFVQLPAPARWLLLIALCLGVIVWCWRQLRWVRRQRRVIERNHERFIASIRAEHKRDGHRG